MHYFSYKKSLYKLRQQEDRFRKAYIKAVDEARKRGGWKEEEKARVCESIDLDMVQDEISSLISDYLTSKAKRTFIALPQWPDPGNGMWEKSRFTERWRLSPDGIAEVSQSIRRVQKEKVAMVSAIVSLLIGLIGTITGLVAVSRR